MGSSQRDKGARGERELAKELYDRLGIELKRNLEQRRNGGYDLIGLPFAIEVKRHEELRIKEWWIQAAHQAIDACEAAGGQYIIPVLAWRQSRKPWTFMVPIFFFFPREERDELGCDSNLIKWCHTATVDVDTFCFVVRERWL